MMLNNINYSPRMGFYAYGSKKGTLSFRKLSSLYYIYIFNKYINIYYNYYCDASQYYTVYINIIYNDRNVDYRTRGYLILLLYMYVFYKNILFFVAMENKDRTPKPTLSLCLCLVLKGH